MQAHNTVSINTHISLLHSRTDGVRLDLLVPLLNPVVGAKRAVGPEELLARRELLALGVDALVEVDVVLPARGRVRTGQTRARRREEGDA